MDLAAIAARESYDFYEGEVGRILKPLKSEEEFNAVLELIKEQEIPCMAANIFVPGSHRITGPDVNETVLRDFVETTMSRAEKTDIKTIVFGSGGARQIPEGFDRKKAHDQIVMFSRMAATLAYNHGVTIAVEPLCKKDCNVLNTIDECAALVREVEHPRFRLLVDSYHTMRDGDSCEDIVKNGSLLHHVHIATVPNRLAPGAEPCDLSEFIGALVKANYSGGVSIEAKIDNPEAELGTALKFMRGLAGNSV